MGESHPDSRQPASVQAGADRTDPQRYRYRGAASHLGFGSAYCRISPPDSDYPIDGLCMIRRSLMHACAFYLLEAIPSYSQLWEGAPDSRPTTPKYRGFAPPLTPPSAGSVENIGTILAEKINNQEFTGHVKNRQAKKCLSGV